MVSSTIDRQVSAQPATDIWSAVIVVPSSCVCAHVAVPPCASLAIGRDVEPTHCEHPAGVGDGVIVGVGVSVATSVQVTIAVCGMPSVASGGNKILVGCGGHEILSHFSGTLPIASGSQDEPELLERPEDRLPRFQPLVAAGLGAGRQNV